METRTLRLAGAEREAVCLFSEYLFRRTARCVVRIDHAGGALMAIFTARVGAEPSCDAVLANPSLKRIARSLRVIDAGAAHDRRPRRARSGWPGRRSRRWSWCTRRAAARARRRRWPCSSSWRRPGCRSRRSRCASCFWSRALDGLPPGPVPAARLARLDADMAIEMQTAPVLAGWLAALRRDVREAGDLDRAIQLLMLARTTWTTTQWMNARAASRPRRSSSRSAPRWPAAPTRSPSGCAASRSAAWVAPRPAAGQGAAW